MTIADAWGQALALMLAWPPITATEIIVWTTFAPPAARAVRGWFT
jgi:hypothetical protein